MTIRHPLGLAVITIGFVTLAPKNPIQQRFGVETERQDRTSRKM